MMKKWVVFGLLVALLFGAFTNFWRLGDIPPGLHADEAMIGYTTFSLLKTGKDLFGLTNYLALSDPNAGGTYPPLRSYILMPFVALMGLSIYVNRIPPALFGIFAVFGVFKICRILFKDDLTALIAAVCMAFNPWATQIARQGLLESAPLTLIIIGIWVFLEAQRSALLYGIAGVLFGLSLFAYDAPRLFLPLFLPLLIWFRWKDISKNIRPAVIGLSIFSIFFSVLVFQIIFNGESREYTHTNIINSISIEGAVIRGRTMTLAPSWVASLVHNKVTEVFREVMTNYVSIFSINWFFINGYGNLQEAVGNHGQYLFFEMPLFFIGWFFLFKRNTRKTALFLLGWILIGALPGGLSSGNFAYRSVLLLPVPLMVSAVGAKACIEYVRRMTFRVRIMVLAVSILVVVVSIGSYLYTYFYDYPVYASEAWALQQNNAIRYAAAHKNTYQYVFIDGGASWAATYGFLFSIDPHEYQQNVRHPTTIGNMQYMNFGGLYFGNLTDAIRVASSAATYFPRHSLVITIGPDNVFPNDVPIMRFMASDQSRSIYKAVIVE